MALGNSSHEDSITYELSPPQQPVSLSVTQLWQMIESAHELLKTDVEAALALGQKAQTTAENIQNNEGLYEAIILQYSILKLLGRDSLAYSKLQNAIAIKKEINDSTNKHLRETIRAKHHIKQKEKEITLLQNEKEIHALQLSNNKVIISIALPSFLLLLGLLFILWKQYQRRKALQLSLKDHSIKTNLLHEELRNINKALIDSEHQLKQINETKNKFFSIVSQDLKSPLNSLSIFLNNFITGSKGATESSAETFVQRINESVTTLSNLINNLLEWSRLQMGSMQYHPKELDLEKNILKNIALIQPQTAHKNITITNEFQAGLEVYADKRMLGFIIRKLMNLFIDGAEEHGTITITTKKIVKKNRFVLIQIKSDKFKNIEHEIFHSWEINSQYMKSSERSRNKALGLILCKEFIGKHGGEIYISEQDMEKQSIHFTIPLA